MRAAEVSSQRPGWAEPVGVRPRPRFRGFCGAIAASAVGFGLVAAMPTQIAAPHADGAGAAVSGTVSVVNRPTDGPCWFTDTFGDPRSGGRVHEGLDIGAAAGTKIYAVFDGRVSKMYADQPGWRGGNALKVAGPDGTYAFYAHLQGFAEGIAVGTQVTAGQVIGYVGKTGNAGVDHLHFELHPGGGAPINPYPIARQQGFCERTGSPKPAPAPPPTSAASNTVAPSTSATRSPGFVTTPADAGNPACVATYLVASGDYWFLIAQNAGVKAGPLAVANDRTIESFIYPGERLCIPAGTWRPGQTPPPSTVPAKGPSVTTTPAPTSAWPTIPCASRYTVNAGDYWFLLARWFQVPAKRLAAANKRPVDSYLYEGESICVPAPA